MMLQESCYQYWVPDGTEKFGEYVIETVSEKRQDGFIERMFKISSDKDDILMNSINIVQFQIIDWPQDGIVREPRTIIQVIDNVIRRQQQIGGGPIVVHCRYTTNHYIIRSISIQCTDTAVIQ